MTEFLQLLASHVVVSYMIASGLAVILYGTWHALVMSGLIAP